MEDGSGHGRIKVTHQGSAAPIAALIWRQNVIKLTTLGDNRQLFVFNELCDVPLSNFDYVCSRCVTNGLVF